MLLEKLCYMKTNINFRSLEQTPLIRVGSRTLFYSISIRPKIYIEDFGKFKHPKIVKSNNNTTVSHLASCRVIPKPVTMKG